MESRNKKSVLVAVAGAVVGAGAVIASVIAMKDKGNQKKIKELVTSTKATVQGFKNDATNQVVKSKENINKMTNQAIKKAEAVTKSAKKVVQTI